MAIRSWFDQHSVRRCVWQLEEFGGNLALSGRIYKNAFIVLVIIILGSFVEVIATRRSIKSYIKAVLVGGVLLGCTGVIHLGGDNLWRGGDYQWEVVESGAGYNSCGRSGCCSCGRSGFERLV